MNNRNGKPAVNEPAKEATEPVVNIPVTEPEKDNFVKRAYKSARKTVIKIKSTRGGRAVIRIAKGTALALGLYESYKLGQKSVKPITMYVDASAETEEEANDVPAEEPEAEQAESEEAEQE